MIALCKESGPDDVPIDIYAEVEDEPKRYESSTTSFSAQIITNNLIKVQSASITSFEVCIFDANDNTPHYQGYTINGILHITTNSLPAGQYILHIKGNGFKYFGNFVIVE